MSQLKILQSVPSTNNYAKTLAKQGAAHGTAVLAKEQTAGRGRMGRSFLSPEGGLYLSVILRPEGPAEHYLALTPTVAVAVCDVLEETVGIRPGIKWINDLILDGKKLAGILTELSLCADGSVEYAICGVGINCNTDLQTLSPEVRQIAASLLDTTGKPVDVVFLASRLAQGISEACFTAVTEKAAWMERFRQDCITIGRQVRVMGAEPYEGLAVGVDEDGALLVDRGGTVEKVLSGEVSVRGLQGYV